MKVRIRNTNRKKQRRGFRHRMKSRAGRKLIKRRRRQGKAV